MGEYFVKSSGVICEQGTFPGHSVIWLPARESRIASRL